MNADGSVSVAHGPRAFITAAPSMEPESFHNYTVMDKTIAYDVDLSTLGCSCNGAFFLTSMPGYTSDGEVDPSDFNNYYCDANKVGGVWCWEMDLMEANKFVSASTPHTCESEAGAYISSCDGAGCGTNNRNQNPNGFGPSDKFLINTTKVFTQYTSFSASGTHVQLVQGENTFDYDVCSHRPNYNASMNDVFESGMTMVLQNWGDIYATMSWLDYNTGCLNACD